MADYKRRKNHPPQVELATTPIAPRQIANSMNATRRQIASRMNGRKGGLATANRYGADFREQRAIAGGQALLARYGIDYFRQHLGFTKERRAAKAAEKAQQKCS